MRFLRMDVSLALAFSPASPCRGHLVLTCCLLARAARRMQVPRKAFIPKCERRCRACVDAGRPGILVRPDVTAVAPNKDSVGIMWFKKHQPASAVLPSVAVTAIPAPAPSAPCIVRLDIVNPTDAAMVVQLDGDVIVPRSIFAEGYGPHAANARVLGFPDAFTLEPRLEGLLASESPVVVKDCEGGTVSVAVEGHKASVRFPVAFVAAADGVLPPPHFLQFRVRLSVTVDPSVLMSIPGLTALPEAAAAAQGMLRTVLSVQVPADEVTAASLPHAITSGLCIIRRLGGYE